MLFNSFPYVLLFLPVVAFVNAGIRQYAGRRWAQTWLLLSSLVFYTCWKPGYVVLLFGSILFNWALAQAMVAREDEDARRIWLWTGLAANVALLCSFKYLNLFLRTITWLHGPEIILPDWDFPLGISFFTLTQVMYLVDTYQGLCGRTSLFDHASVVSFFPYIASGPLVRARDIVSQFREFKSTGTPAELACRGVCLFAIGLAEKVVFADGFARLADVGFGSARDLSTLEAWVFSLAYTFQIYFDFSGYSDMAVGSAWTLGIDIPQNFNAPYRSTSISEFWQRWHISLSKFITNYLFTPILRSMGKATIYTAAAATLIAMGIAGFWHGPAWKFVIFGLLHGVAIAINQAWKKQKRRLPDWLGWSVTMALVNVAFVFFRSTDVGFATHFVAAMLPRLNLVGTGALRGAGVTLIFPQIVIGAIVSVYFKTSQETATTLRLSRMAALATAALMLVCWYFMDASVTKQFVYAGF